ncbi:MULTISPECIES: SIS domain-containing protein [Rhodococcus]|uniref:Glutamine--fructose-6-phosphate aminotransferase [isomerizing] n=1 Tax=Rhodococcus opacus RKJ300 = JCM 13270 TaxID=1165867 RepID=I0WPF5_RHOOP|nr:MULTISPECIES: SIS domain-containing protein [Rhodococcus]EID78271.1 sugar isomerase [Rhodococcus opacus RKJ300 = JCM 13270]KAF0961828.1 hypothetical protein MLGJGCBP_05054 [Rhodococcus sp. T7]QQZ18257.1 SIS domain-containing protein [Rhodococcus sp. 21391]UOT08193.1 SIS domain-containing protein [Rhodococcus opacus]
MKYSINTMAHELDCLAPDFIILRDQLVDAATGVVRGWPDLDEVLVLGAGDSHHAALACGLAFGETPGLSYRALSARDFIGYGAHQAGQTRARLVIGVSASGGNPSAAEGLRLARAAGDRTLAVTLDSRSSTATAADDVLTASLANLGLSPGIRTYQFSLIALLAVAAAIAAARDPLAGRRVNLLSSGDLAAVIAEVRQTKDHSARELAESLYGISPLVFAGNGPALGTAKHAAAKVVEASGIFAIGVDPEDWWHVHRFATPTHSPLILIGSGRRSFDGALPIWDRAAALGRPVVLITAGDNASELPEHLTPLVDHVTPTMLALHLARRSGRWPFEPL